VRNKLLIPFSFTLMNWAAVAALVHYARGRTDVWVRSRDRFGSGLFQREQQWNY
jgi:hypothetical protein